MKEGSQYTLEQISKIQQRRESEDSRLLITGAKLAENGRIHVTPHQIEDANEEMENKSELTPEKVARKRLVEYVKDAKLESPRFQAFADFTDLHDADQHKDEPRFFRWHEDMILETIRQRINGVKYYKTEYEQIKGLITDYGIALDKKYSSDDRFPKDRSSVRSLVRTTLAVELKEIKDQEIDKRNRQSQTPRNKKK